MKKRIIRNAKNDKGFTLVELIVVLVILAILAAILVPALLGYIDRSKQSQFVLNAKSFYTAAQAVASEDYGNPSAWSLEKNGNSYLAITNSASFGRSARPSGWTGDFTAKLFEKEKQAYNLCDASSMSEFSAVAVIKKYRVVKVAYRDEATKTIIVWDENNPTWTEQTFTWDWIKSNSIALESGHTGATTDVWYNANK